MLFFFFILTFLLFNFLVFSLWFYDIFIILFSVSKERVYFFTKVSYFFIFIFMFLVSSPVSYIPFYHILIENIHVHHVYVLLISSLKMVETDAVLAWPNGENARRKSASNPVGRLVAQQPVKSFLWLSTVSETVPLSPY